MISSAGQSFFLETAFFVPAALCVRRHPLAQRKKYGTDANRYADVISSVSSSSMVRAGTHRIHIDQELVQLIACGGAEEKAGFDPEITLQALADAGAFSEELEELDGDTAFTLYGLGTPGWSGRI